MMESSTRRRAVWLSANLVLTIGCAEAHFPSASSNANRRGNAATALHDGGRSDASHPGPVAGGSSKVSRNGRGTTTASNFDASPAKPTPQDSGTPDASHQHASAPTPAPQDSGTPDAGNLTAAELTGLAVSPGMLDPTFDAAVTQYHVTVSLWTDTVTVTATARSGVSIRIDDQPVVSGSPWLSPVLALGDTTFSITISEPGRVDRLYSLVVTRPAMPRRLQADNPATNDWFGQRVALSGDTLVVTGRGAQAVYVLVRSADGWMLQATLAPGQAGTGSWFGSSLAVAGDTIVVGSPSEGSGAAYVYARNNGTWSQQASLQASNAAASDGFGGSVAIAGDTIVVGAPNEDSSAKGVDGNQNDDSATDSGAAYVFVRNSGSWTQQAYAKASNTGAGDGFGAAVAIYGDTIVISSPMEDSASPGVNGDQNDESATDSGAAYVLVRNNGSWTQQAYLKASNPGGPDSLTDQGDQFGGGESLPSRGVAIWGDTIAVGAGGEDSNASGIDGDQSNDQRVDAGAVYVFVRDAGGWAQQAYIKASNPGGSAQFGSSVALFGERLAVGAWQAERAAAGVNGDQRAGNLARAGAAYVFVRDAVGWRQRWYLKASDPGAEAFFGWSVAIYGDTVAVGAPTPTSSAIRPGSVYLFE